MGLGIWTPNLHPLDDEGVGGNKGAVARGRFGASAEAGSVDPAQLKAGGGSSKEQKATTVVEDKSKQ